MSTTDHFTRLQAAAWAKPNQTSPPGYRAEGTSEPETPVILVR